MNVSKITLSRLYNLGNYEHFKAEVTVDLEPTDIPSAVFTNLEKVLHELTPELDTPTQGQIDDMTRRLQKMKKVDDQEFENYYSEYGRDRKSITDEAEKTLFDAMQRRGAYLLKRETAIANLNNLGGWTEISHNPLFKK